MRDVELDRRVLVRSEPMARQPRPVGGLLACFDPLLRRAALVVEPHDRATREDHVGHDEADAGKQLTPVVLHLSDNPSGPGPALRLIGETLVAYQGLAAWPSRRAKHNVFDVPLQALVRRYADRIIHVALLERLIDRRPGERRVRAERHARAPRLLPFHAVQWREVSLTTGPHWSGLV